MMLRRVAGAARLPILAVVLLAFSQAAAAADTSAQAPAGQTLFRRHCGPCHSQGGTGTFMLGRRLGEQNALLESRTNLDNAYVRAVVRGGIQSMPRLSRAELPDADLARIAQYLAAPPH